QRPTFETRTGRDEGRCGKRPYRHPSRRGWGITASLFSVGLSVTKLKTPELVRLVVAAKQDHPAQTATGSCGRGGVNGSTGTASEPRRRSTSRPFQLLTPTWLSRPSR